MARFLLLTTLLIASCSTAKAQIYRVAQMNTEQIRALDKDKTVVILTGGILEEHGPHLPSFTDGYSNEWLTQKLAEEIVQRPGMSVLLFPTIPLGHEGGNEIGATHVFPFLRFVDLMCCVRLPQQAHNESRPRDCERP